MDYMKKASGVKKLLCLVFCAALLLAAPASAKYTEVINASGGGTTTLVWTGPASIETTAQPVNDNQTLANSDAIAAAQKIEIVAGENDGWYAFIIWGACGGTGSYRGVVENYGQGGCVKGVAYFDPGTYHLVAGVPGAHHQGTTVQPVGSWYSGIGGGAGYFISDPHRGGGGGGLSGIFKGSIAYGNAIAVAGGGGGGSASNGGATNNNAGGWGGGNNLLAGFYGIGNVGAVAHGPDYYDYVSGAVSVGADDRRGGSSRNLSGTGRPAPNWERAAGGGVEHMGTSNSNTTDRSDGDGFNPRFSGGGYCDRDNGVKRYAESGSGWQGGTAGGVNAAGGGGGGGGYPGGGAGGDNNIGADNPGGGGGGASFIIASNGGKDSLTYRSNAGSPGFGTGAATNDSSKVLDLKIAGYLNDVFTDTMPSGRFAGKVVLIYLGPNDPTTTTFDFNW